MRKGRVDQVFKEMDKSYIENLSQETKLSYIITDIIFNKGNLNTKLRVVSLV